MLRVIEDFAKSLKVTRVSKVYFRPLKKGVVLPLAIVKSGRATP